MNNQLFTKENLSNLNSKYLAIWSVIVSTLILIGAIVLVLSDNVDAESKAPTKEEIITNLNLEINQLDLDVINKTTIYNKADEDFKTASKNLDDAKDKRAIKLKEKAGIMEGKAPQTETFTQPK